jgi:hypothetical protein
MYFVALPIVVFVKFTVKGAEHLMVSSAIKDADGPEAIFITLVIESRHVEENSFTSFTL